MKLKYYLRGIGIGVIVATLIMTVSSVIHNNNLSDEVIIKEAQKLGMIMPENTEDKDSLWQKNTETEDVETEVVLESSELEDATETDVSTETQMMEEPEIVTVYVEEGEYAQQVAKKLEDAGLIEDAEDFHRYLKKIGYTTRIRSGYHEILSGSTYEEIAQNLRRK